MADLLPSEEQHQAFLAAIEPMRAALADVIAGTQELQHHQPAADSLAMAELADEADLIEALGGSPGHNARMIGGFQLMAAERHVEALGLLITARESILYSGEVLGRAAIEACARSFWLLDAALSARERAARGMTERLYGMWEVMRLTGDRARYRAQSEALLADAKQAGYPTHHRKKASHYVGRTPRPDATTAMSQVMAVPGVDLDVDLGKLAQRYLSMFVHATTPGLLLAAGDRSGALPIDDLTVRVPLYASSDQVNTVLALVGSAYVRAAAAQLGLSGWTTDDWQKKAVNLAGLSRQVTRSN
jgi:hypothetical protein